MILKKKSSIRYIISLFIGLCYVHSTYSDGYIITTPRRWTSGSESQVCLSFRDGLSEGENNLTLSIASPNRDSYILPEQSLTFNAESGLCNQVLLPRTKDNVGLLNIYGTILGIDVNYSQKVTIATDVVETYIQTDKYKYKPSQIVKFRILTVMGPKLKISTDQYEEIFVKNPSGSRIFQWLNISNEIGLIHQEFQLSDEPEKGIYRIYVKSTDNNYFDTTFKVEDYVLPRYEVTIKGPVFILGTAVQLTFKVCAMYTFGQPVTGTVKIKVAGAKSTRSGNTITKQGDISGCGEMTFTSEELGYNNGNTRYYLSYNVRATVTEAGTHVALHSNDLSIPVRRTAVIFHDMSVDAYYKQELPYVGQVKVTFRDGKPASNELMEVDLSRIRKILRTNSDGILKYAIPPHLRYNYVYVTALNYPRRRISNRVVLSNSVFFKKIESYHSPSSSSLSIELHDPKVNCVHGQDMRVSFTVSYAATEVTIAKVSIQMISRGQIIFASNEMIDFRTGSTAIDYSDILISPVKDSEISNITRGSFTKTAKITGYASPQAKLLVFYTRPDGEVVSDVRTVHIEECLPNPTSLSWSTKKAQPGEEAVLSLTGEPNSICSLGVVDKSVDLLSAKTTKLTIFNLLEVARKASSKRDDFSLLNAKEYCKNKKFRATQGDIYWTKTYGDKIPYLYETNEYDALTMFDKAGVYAFSDMQMESRTCTRGVRKHRGRWIRPNANGIVSFRRGGGGGPRINKAEEEPTQPELVTPTPRTYLPETWLWQIYIIPNTGLCQDNYTLPHTITEWVASAVCVHPTMGVGISNTAPIITFTDFFTDVTLPVTVKRGETFPVKISVFNYLNEPLPINIIVDQSSEYEILSVSGTTFGSGERSSCIPKNDKIVHSIRIRATAIGNINITVTAFVDVNALATCGNGTDQFRVDTLIKPIRVDVEGFMKEKTWSQYACSNNTLDDWSITVPENIVPDSERGFIAISKKLMGPTIENLGNLVRKPYGCGEQNMINFAPNIFVMPYLDKPEAKSIALKAIKFMQRGYQRELNYRHDDGSYSAFGKRDDSGSTWLTSFVLKSFAQARNYISIDRTDLTKSQNWLKMMQQSDGCFKSVGIVLHKGMKGGISGNSAPSLLSSFVMIALLEAGEDPNGSVINATLRCINANTTEDSYALAVKAYALALANDPATEKIIQQLIDKAESPHMHWPSSELGSSVEVETAGYAILAMLTFDSTRYASKAENVTKWMNDKRNGQGGFVSTQDTIVGLQAMALYDTIFEKAGGALDLFIEMSSPSSPHMKEGHSIYINQTNDLLMQKVSMPYMPVDIKFNLSGEGCMMIQSVLRYNEPLPEPSKAFNLSLKAYPLMDKVCIYKALITCVSYLLPDLESNMGIVEVTLVSGYVPMISDLEKVIAGDSVFKRYEVDGNLVTVYVDKFTDQKLCFSFGMELEIEIENPKPGTVKVYDYYKPEYYVTETYVFPDRCITVLNG